MDACPEHTRIHPIQSVKELCVYHTCQRPQYSCWKAGGAERETERSDREMLREKPRQGKKKNEGEKWTINRVDQKQAWVHTH